MDTKMPEKRMDEAVTQALERAPVAAIPADFAARVRVSLPPQRAPRRTAQAGTIVAVAAAVLLVVALFVLAPHAQPGFASLNFYIELLLLTELFGIAYWLAAKQGSRG